MKAEFYELREALRTPFALSCGQTAKRWQGELARWTAKLDALRRLCAWVETLIQWIPWINQEPLFGRCLRECANGTRRTVERRPKVIRRRLGNGGSIRPGEASGKEKQSCREGLREKSHYIPEGLKAQRRDARSCKPLPEKLDLTKKASHDLLCALAGASSSGCSGEKPSHAKEAPVCETEPVHVNNSRDFLRVCSQWPEAQPTAGPHRAVSYRAADLFQENHRSELLTVWKENLSWRACQTFQSFGLMFDQRENGDSFLLQHWAVPIAGPEAPTELLAPCPDWEQPTPSDEPESRQRLPDEAWEPAFSDSRRKRDEGRDVRDEVRSHDGHGAAPGESGFAPRAPKSALEATTFVPPVFQPPSSWSSALGTDRRVFRNSERAFSEKLDSSSYVPIHLPSRTEHFFHREGTTEQKGEEIMEAESGEEELHALRAKLKRILDEEARRFGINV